MATTSTYKNLIYGLQDPITQKIRYIGKTQVGMKLPKNHLLPCYYKNKKYSHLPVYRWINKLLKIHNKLPVIVIIQQFETIETKDLNLCEKYWISYFSENTLLNLTIGGDGVVGHKWNDEQRTNLKEIRKSMKLSEEHKQKCRENAKIARQCVNFENVSIGAKKWWKKLNPDIQHKIINNLKRTTTYNRKKIKDQYGNVFNSLKEAADFLKCSSSLISMNMKLNRPCKGHFFVRVK